jgi:membrane-bound lytic murein transglycosylase D
LTRPRLRLPRPVLLISTLLALSACAHNPPKTPVSAQLAAVPSIAAAPVSSVPAGEGVTPLLSQSGAPAPSDAATPANTVADASVDNGATAAALAPTQVAGLAPAQYADLFDRMRAGFKLGDDGSHRAVDDQLRWYAGNPDYLQRAFGRADLYLYYIVTELERRNMPLELALLPVVESAFEPYAYSPARASGLWQFIPGTGSRFGLKQNWWYDGRRDIVESTRAALDYLQYLHDEFDGDWLLAIAAYNCGEAMVERAVEANRAAGRSVEFWNLWLPGETRAYVPKLLAMKRLVADPETYGLAFSPIPNQPYFARVETAGQINLKLAAQIAGITPEELYELNPAFHRFATDPTGPNFLLLPVDAADVFSENVTLLSEEQRLGVTRYTVRRGDSVVSVAKRFNTTATVIREMNGLPQGPLTVGDDVRVPSAVTELPPKVMMAAARVDGGHHGRGTRAHVQVVRHGDSLWTIARRHGMSVDTLAMMNGMHPDDALRAGQRIKLSQGTAAPHKVRHLTYTVREGDTVAQIARLFQCSVPQLLSWNGLTSKSRIHTGQKLRIHLGTHRS